MPFADVAPEIPAQDNPPELLEGPNPLAGTPAPRPPRMNTAGLPYWVTSLHPECVAIPQPQRRCYICRSYSTTIQPDQWAVIQQRFAEHAVAHEQFQTELAAWVQAQPVRICERCGTRSRIHEGYLFGSSDPQHFVCNYCRGALDSCDTCHELRFDIEYSQHGTGYQCASCANGLDRCPVCDGTYRLNAFGEPPMLCRVYRRQIYSYSYKPRPVFHKLNNGDVVTGAKGEDRTPYLGFELEMHCDGERDAVLHVMNGEIGDLAYPKEDGSLHNGIELVTHPMTYAYALEHFPWSMLDKLDDEENEGNAYVDDGAGLHVHVSKAAFDNPAHEYRWLLFWHRNTRSMLALARRVSTEWAAFDGAERKLAKRMVQKKVERYELGRYRAINALPEHTYEVRMFRASLDATEVQAALALVAASVEYSRELDAHGVLTAKGWEFVTFAQWVARKPLYAALTSEIQRLGLDTVPARRTRKVN